MTRSLRQRLYGVAALLTGGAWLWLEPLADFMGREDTRHDVGLAGACFLFTSLWERQRRAGRTSKTGEERNA